MQSLHPPDGYLAASDVPGAMPVDCTIEMLPRRAMRVVDARSRNSDAFRDPNVTAWIDRIKRRNSRPIRVCPESLYSGQQLDLFRTGVWRGNRIVRGTMNPGFELGRRPEKHDTMLAELKAFRTSTRVDRRPGTWAEFELSGCSNYYHWLIETLPRLSRLRRLIECGQIDGIVRMLGQKSRFQDATLDLFFADMADYVEAAKDVIFRPDTLVFHTKQVERWDSAKTNITETILAFLRSLDRPDTPGDKVVFISRAQAKKRKILNEEALIEHLRKRFDVDVVVAETLSFGEQIDRMRNAYAIVGAHGAGLSNLCFAPRGSKLVELTTAGFFQRSTSFMDLALICGIDPCFVLLDHVGGAGAPYEIVNHDMVASPEAFGLVADAIEGGERFENECLP